MIKDVKKIILSMIPESIRAYLGRNLNDNSDTSQHGEISVLMGLVRENYPKYLVDVGAHNGVYLSNSYPFIEEGWHAIAIEPLPKPFAQLQATYQQNKNVVCVNKACSNAVGTAQLFIGSDGDVGTMATLCADDNEWFDAHRTNNYVEVVVDTLTNILTEAQFPQDFSLLLVDAEGMDYEVLLGLDFDKFQPRIIVTEDYEVNPEKHQKKFQLLENNGYTLAEHVGCNTIWIK